MYRLWIYQRKILTTKSLKNKSNLFRTCVLQINVCTSKFVQCTVDFVTRLLCNGGFSAWGLICKKATLWEAIICMEAILCMWATLWEAIFCMGTSLWEAILCIYATLWEATLWEGILWETTLYGSYFVRCNYGG